MGFGLGFRNDNDTAVLTADAALGFEYHGKLTVGNRLAYYNGINNIFGAEEVWGLANCPSYPIVFLCDMTNLPAMGSMSYPYTSRMVAVTGIRPSTTSGYDWDIIITRGYDQITSSTNTLSLLIFKPVSQSPNGTYGMIMRNSDGDTTFDSTRKMLIPKAQSAISTINANQVLYLDISNLGISRPAVSWSALARARLVQTPYFICAQFYGIIYGFANSNDDICMAYCRVGHGVNDGTTYPYDTCDTVEPYPQWDVNFAYFPYIIIDADDYD